MLRKLLFIGCWTCIVVNAVAQDHVQLHKSLTIVDGHNDVIISSILKGRDIGSRLSQGHTDIPRLLEGGLDVQVFAVWSNDKKW